MNPYRFNSARFDGATGTYDMGFRESNPSLNRFLTRDMFNGALTDLALGTDPWNANRYMFAGGNPISRIELNGHYAIEEGGDRFEPHDTPTITSPTTTGSTGSSTPQVPNNVGQEINESIGPPAGASQQQQAIRMSQMGINPAIAGLNLGADEFNKTGIPDATQAVADVTGVTDASNCANQPELKSCGMTALILFPWAKLGKAARALAGLKHADDAAKAGATVGHAASTNYRATFFAANPRLEGKVVVHHAVEQQVLKRYPGLFSEAEIHSLENLRGIPVGSNSSLHLSQIRRSWNAFYRSNSSLIADGRLESCDRSGSSLRDPVPTTDWMTCLTDLTRRSPASSATGRCSTLVLIHRR